MGELLRDIYAKNERRLYGQTQSDEEEPLSYVVVKCITRLLFRGHCNETLMSMLTIYILTDGFNTDELRKDLYRLITKDDVVSALPKILKLVLSEVILRIPSIAPDQVLKMFGRLSNPVSLKKVTCVFVCAILTLLLQGLHSLQQRQSRDFYVASPR